MRKNNTKNEKPIHCKDLKITMDVMIQVERVIDRDQLLKLATGEAIDISFEQQFKLLTIITELEPEEISELDPQEVAFELGFFTAKLAQSYGKGRQLSALLPFFLLSSKEINQLLETFTSIYPTLCQDLIERLSAALPSTSETTRQSRN